VLFAGHAIPATSKFTSFEAPYREHFAETRARDEPEPVIAPSGQMRATSYFLSTGISKPRNSNAASRLIQPCNEVATIGSFGRTDRLALLLFLHVEAEEFERLVAVYPAVPRMRVRKWLMTWRRRSKASMVVCLDTLGEVRASGSPPRV